MRVSLLLGSAAALAVLPAAAVPAAAGTSPSPRPVIGTAGTSFLTATTVEPGQPVRVPASTGDYLYWSFAAAAGQTGRIAVTVALPPAASRHGAATYAIDVFDGLRRRQACTAGPQNATAAAGTASVRLQCTLRQVRAWAEPWSDDPLPGTYYLRLAASGLPEQDLGLPIRADVRITAKNGTAQPAGAKLKAPLSPAVAPGATLAPGATPSSGPVNSAPKPAERVKGWFSWPSSRWWWTIGGGVLAAVLAVGGYHLTRHPRRWFSALR
ncbi:peptidase [Actinomadura harenae]|uniref:Peptidase n=1 Tax=Actinomadura harenae TaxID=2483351 RepID=A0A3M2LQE9_9ACTN|nr:peptidase [Actinomadura harenae]RMI37068.1 peptidase [Actinomadura harenae]